MTLSPSIYNEIGISTEVMSASSHRLIQMLFEKFLQQMNLAKQSIEKNDRNGRNNCITRGNDIIVHLRGCLNYESEETKKFSDQLNSTYVLVQKCLLNATLKNDPEYIDLAFMMITNVKSGWDQISSSAS